MGAGARPVPQGRAQGRAPRGLPRVVLAFGRDGLFGCLFLFFGGWGLRAWRECVKECSVRACVRAKGRDGALAQDGQSEEISGRVASRCDGFSIIFKQEKGARPVCPPPLLFVRSLVRCVFLP